MLESAFFIFSLFFFVLLISTTFVQCLRFLLLILFPSILPASTFRNMESKFVLTSLFSRASFLFVFRFIRSQFNLPLRDFSRFHLIWGQMPTQRKMNVDDSIQKVKGNYLLVLFRKWLHFRLFWLFFPEIVHCKNHTKLACFKIYKISMRLQQVNSNMLNILFKN